MSQAILNEAQVRFKKAVDHTLHEFANIHTGKASPSMVEGIMVEAYGSMMRIKDCAAISTPDARQIVIQPWDKGLTQAISKAIQIANLGFNNAARSSSRSPTASPRKAACRCATSAAMFWKT
jgi:ribosome recycling factor